VATAFFLLRDTRSRVLLIERGRLARGATGHNAGQIVSYFERPLYKLVEDFGFELAIESQRDIESAWGLLDAMIAEADVRAPIQRFLGHMGMFSLDHLEVHLRNNRLRAQGGLETESCVVSEEAPFLEQISSDHAGLYATVPQRRVQELLETRDPRYCAVLSYRKGCGNAALLCQQVLDHMLRTWPERFRFVDHTPVERVRLGSDHALLDARGHRVRAGRVALCTNGFVDHVIENLVGDAIATPLQHRVSGNVGFMTALVEPHARPPAAISYLASPRIGHGQAYYYVTRRPFEADGGTHTLTCIGGPDLRIEDRSAYRAEAAFPAEMLERIDDFIRPLLDQERSERFEYDYAWHGLMAYTPSQVRQIGAEPRNPVLLYNLGCNGVGFLPSIYGGHRLARIVAGERLSPSLFDPA
jgi:glycine/D-amino acid oxidase-like deaminating enzyme